MTTTPAATSRADTSFTGLGKRNQSFIQDEAESGIGANCLWPRTIIATAAVQNLLGGDEAMAAARTPDIYADAAYEILSRDPRECTGNAFIDDEVLAEAGVTDFSQYSAPDAELALDLFVDDWGPSAPA